MKFRFALVAVVASLATLAVAQAETSVSCSANCGFFRPRVAHATTLFSLPIMATGATRADALAKLEEQCKKRNPAGFVYVQEIQAAPGYVLDGEFSRMLIQLKDSAESQEFACAPAEEVTP